MKSIIVDDESLGRRLIQEFLRKHQDIQIVGECDNGEDAISLIEATTPNLIFLDIHMPKLSGLEVLELTGRRTGVIFTTAYDQYAIKAFEMHAIDYLLKPFSQERFDAALHRARQLMRADSDKVKTLLEQSKLNRIAIRERGQTLLVNVDKVDYIEAQDDYIMIFSEGKSLMKTQTLSQIEAQLDTKKFVRIHRSYLINIEKLDKIEKINKDSVMAIMQGGTKLPISRTGQEKLRNL